MPVGKRPRPTVAQDHKASYNTAGTGRHPGRSSSKTPTGKRPRPTVAKNSMPSAKMPGLTRKAIRLFPMPSPKAKWAKRGGGKPHGGS